MQGACLDGGETTGGSRSAGRFRIRTPVFVGFPQVIFAYGAHLARVEVDLSIGEIRACDYPAATDGGTVINPVLFDQQIHGGIAQGLGFALMEEVVIRKGAVQSNRNMAAIGGNICTASPAGDSLTPLHLLDAAVEVVPRQGRRVLAIGEFITGPEQTNLRPGEILRRILLPQGTHQPFQSFEKIGRRRSMAIAVVTFAGMVRLSDDGLPEEIHLAWGSVAIMILRIPSLEAERIGVRPDRTNLDRFRQNALRFVSPISDIRAGVEYRRAVAGNLMVRFLEGLRG